MQLESHDQVNNLPYCIANDPAFLQDKVHF